MTQAHLPRTAAAVAIAALMTGPLANRAISQEPARVFRGARVLTVAAGEIPDADLVVAEGKIVAVGGRGDVALPEGAEVIDVSARVIIPGIVDTHSHIGIHPRPSILAHADGNESTGAAQPVLRALDAIWPDDPGFRMARAGGVTTANIMPGSGNAIGGQTLYVKLRSGPIEAMMVTPGQPEGGLKMANGENPKRSYGPKGQPPGTRMKLAAIQREMFLKARDYQRKWQELRDARARGADSETPQPPEVDLALEPLVEVLERKRTVHFHSHRADDIRTVMRLADEFGFEVVLQHGTESPRVAEELAKRNIPVSMTIVDSPGGKAETLGLSEESAALLRKAGVKIAINSDDSITESRFLLRTAAIAVRGGLPEAEALRALTLSGAEMLHLEHRTGSIEPGKDADFVVLSGAPFRVYTQVLQTYLEGQKVYDRYEPPMGNDAIGGFAITDVARRPAVPPPVVAAPWPPAPAGGVDALPGDPGPGLVAIRAGRLCTVAGAPIDDGMVVFESGRIRAVGKASELGLPEGTPVLCAAAATPGLIDAHTVVGVSGILNVPADQDQDERNEPNQADLRVLDGLNPDEPLLAHALRHGVTVAQICPGRASVIAGQAGIFRTHGKTSDEMVVRFPSGMLFNLGEVPKSGHEGKPPATRMGTAAVVRNALAAARNHALKVKVADVAKRPDSNPKHEALALVLQREIPAIFSAHRSDDLLTALRISREFGTQAVLDLATEAYLVPDEVAAAGVPVLVHPTMQRVGSPETLHSSLTNAAALGRRGIHAAIVTAFEGYVPKTRTPLHEAAVAMSNGLDYNHALRAITLDAARILAIDTDYGSIEPGKVADLVLFDGDPFDYPTHVTHVIMNGRVVYDRTTAPRLLGMVPALEAAGGNCCLSLE
jgi:imidazolonepropionase-like amidohydrolase